MVVDFLDCVDRFSKIPSAEVYENSNKKHFQIFLYNFLVHGVPRRICCDYAGCQIVKQNGNFCEQINFDVIAALINYRKDIRLEEHSIQTIKHGIGSIRGAAKSQFNLKSSIN